MDKIKKLAFIVLIAVTAIPIGANAITIPNSSINNYLQKNKFLGNWNMQTIVTKSKCPYVLVGSTTESKLEIKQNSELRGTKPTFKVLWKGGDWSASTGTIKLLNEKEAITERVTEFKTDKHEKWKAVLIDHLKLDENDSIHSESIVIQYKNGISVGEYKTFSILIKSNDNIE